MSTDLPSFDKAQYALTPAPGTAPQDRCSRCQQPIVGSYYRIGDDLACPSCAAQATPNLPTDSHAAFTRAVLFGIGAAILGMIAYALFEIATGLIIGYLAIGVGFLVGKAMKLGSNGRGGRRYQIVAALLTYAAVSMAAIPVAIHSYTTHKHIQTSSAQTTPSTGAGVSADTSDSDAAAPTSHQPTSPTMAILTLVGLGLTSPFVELTSGGFGGLIGLFILFLGIRFAWNFTAGHDLATTGISGPYTQPGTA